MLVRLILKLPSCDSIRCILIRECNFDLMHSFITNHGGRIVGVEAV